MTTPGATVRPQAELAQQVFQLATGYMPAAALQVVLRLGIPDRDMGTGMDDADVTRVGAHLDIAALLAYRNAVGMRTREVVPTLPNTAWDDPIDPARLLAAGAFPNRADGEHRVATYWQNRTRGYILTTSLTTHNFQHLGEANAIKSLVGRMVRDVGTLVLLRHGGERGDFLTGER